MDRSWIIQLLGSALAVGGLVALAAWARIGRPTPPLDAQGARALLAEEFPGDRIDALWVTLDGGGVVARSGSRGLVLWRKGDGYVARETPWASVLVSATDTGGLRLKFGDGAVRLALPDETWPPPGWKPAS